MPDLRRAVLRTTTRLPRRLLRRLAGEPLEIDGNVLDLQMQVVAEVAARRRLGEVTPATVRARFREMCATGSHGPVEAVSVHDRTIDGPGGDLPVRIYHPPATSGSVPAIVWFHQGGAVIGDLDTDHSLCTTLSDRTGAAVVSVGYRLGPEHRFPAAVDDAIAAHQWVLDHADGLSVDPARVAVGGTSAGGTLAAVICHERRNQGAPQPAAQILLYPGVDQTAQGGSRDSCAECFPLSAGVVWFFSHHYLPDRSAAADLRASPGLATEFWGLAPAVVVTAGFDPLRDEGDRYATAMKGAGVQVRHRCEHTLTHSFTVFGGVCKEARRAIDRVADDVAAVLHVD